MPDSDDHYYLAGYSVETAPTRMERDYNAGRTTQVPTGRVIGIKGRLRRRLGYNGFTLSFERA